MTTMAPPLVDVLRSASCGDLICRDDRNDDAFDLSSGADVSELVNASLGLFAGPDAGDEWRTWALSESGWDLLKALGATSGVTW